MSRRIVCAAAVLASAMTTAAAASPSAEWPLPNRDLASTRALPGSRIDRSNVGRLHPAWRFRLRIPPGESGAITATPVVADGVVYVQDMKSNVFALDLETGRLVWRHRFNASTPGPNGLAAADGRVYGNTDSSAFALDAKTGRLIWRRFLVTQTARYVEIAAQVAHGTVYTSTIGLPPNGKGVLYALDAATGAIRWRLSTIEKPWRIRFEAGGGGAWYPPSVAGANRVLGRRQPVPLWRDPRAPKRRRVRRAGALHRLAARARRPERRAPMARPGHAPRRARLRLPAAADPRRRRRDGASSSAPARPAS